ncbi:MAG: 50S ribosomal protein L15 [Planctomycetota bacterium]
MHIADITDKAGADRRPTRVGRGEASGLGKTCGRGHKGCGQRSGWKQRGLQEGGQMPTFRRIPKRGFTNAKFTERFVPVNVGSLEKAFTANAHVTAQVLLEAGLIRSLQLPVKILGEGTLTKKLTVEAAKFSRSAEEKIKTAGGEARVG